MSTHHPRLEAAITRRNATQQTVQRLQGRLQVAKEEVLAIEKECQDRGISPDKIDNAVAQLERRFEAELVAFEADVAATEGRLAPYLEDRK